MLAFDTHCHLQRGRFLNAGFAEETVRSWSLRGIREVLVPAVGPEDWAPNALSALRSLPSAKRVTILTSCGIHPLKVAEEGGERLLSHLETAPWGQCVAVGETGLDRRPQFRASFDAQVRALSAHLAIARARSLPTVLHCVRAHEELLHQLDAAPVPPSIVHGFAGSPELAREYTRRGHVLGLGGVLLDPRARRLQASVRAVPLEHWVVETDAPDGRWADPARRFDAIDVIEALALARGEPATEVAAVTRANAARILGIAELAAST